MRTNADGLSVNVSTFDEGQDCSPGRGGIMKSLMKLQYYRRASRNGDALGRAKHKRNQVNMWVLRERAHYELHYIW